MYNVHHKLLWILSPSTDQCPVHVLEPVITYHQQLQFTVSVVACRLEQDNPELCNQDREGREKEERRKREGREVWSEREGGEREEREREERGRREREREERGRRREGGEREREERGRRREGGERGREQASSPIHFQWSILSLNSTTGRKKGRGSKEESAPTSAER